MTLTARAATALRGVQTKPRAMKEMWNIVSVILIDKGLTSTSGCSNNVNGSGSSSSSYSGELIQQENLLGTCSREWLDRGCELLKRTLKGDLHWKRVSVYINKMNQVYLSLKSSACESWGWLSVVYVVQSWYLQIAKLYRGLITTTILEYLQNNESSMSFW